MDNMNIKKNEDLIKENVQISARFGSLRAMFEKDRELTVKSAQDFFDRCGNIINEANAWCVKAANFIDTCNAGTLEGVDKDNLDKAEKAYKLKKE